MVHNQRKNGADLLTGRTVVPRYRNGRVPKKMCAPGRGLVKRGKKKLLHAETFARPKQGQNERVLKTNKRPAAYYSGSMQTLYYL